MREEAKKLMKIIRDSIKKDMIIGRKDTNPRTIHISSLYDLCIRRIDIALKEGCGYAPPQPIDLGRAFTFKQGRYLQQLIVDSLIENHPDITLHRFVCSKCRSYIVARGKAKTCPNCGRDMFRDEVILEYKVPDTSFTITGSIDLLIGFNDFYPFEIKSVRAEDFDNDKPIYRYMYQLGGYLWLIERVKPKMISNKFGILLYVCKAHKQNPIKGFFVTPEKVKGVWSDIARTIADLKNYERTGATPRLCKHKADPIGRGCPFRDKCWKED